MNVRATSTAVWPGAFTTDYEYTVDSHYYDYENEISRLNPMSKNYLTDFYIEFEDRTFNNETNPIFYQIDKNKITVYVRAYYTGLYNEILDGKTRKKLIEEGITEKWNNSFIGTVYDFYPGLPVEVEFIISERTSPFNSSTEKAITINVTDSNGRSTTGRASFSSNIDSGMMTMRNYKSSVDTYKETAAHEFGHILGLADAYSISELDLLFMNVAQDEIILNEIMKSGFYSVVTISDIEMALESAFLDQYVYFSPSTERKMSGTIKQRQIYRLKSDEPTYKKDIDYIWMNGKGYLPKDAEKRVVGTQNCDLIYYLEGDAENQTATIYGLADNTYSGPVIIPSFIQGTPVTSICDGAFRNTAITSLVLEDANSIEVVGQAAFYDCDSLESISLPNDVAKIRQYTFKNCINLNSINIPEKVTLIEKEAFYNCHSITNITIPKSVNKIDYKSFYQCTNLTDVSIKDGLKIIGEAAFESCGLISITVPATVEEIGAYAFYDCYSLNAVEFLAVLFDIEKYHNNLFFESNNLKEIYVPSESVSVYNNWIGEYANNHNILIISKYEIGGRI